jgi:hypothetical protein
VDEVRTLVLTFKSGAQVRVRVVSYEVRSRAGKVESLSWTAGDGPPYLKFADPDEIAAIHEEA